MTNAITTELYEEFLRLAEAGDENAARAFLTDRYKDFPEEMQEKVMFAFFSEAVTKRAAEIEGVTKIQQEGMEMLTKLIAEKKKLEDQLRIDDLKKTLGAQ